MTFYFYDSDRTLKVKEILDEKINKVESIKQALDLLDEITKDFLSIYDSLAKETDHLQRIAELSTERSNEIDKLRGRNKILFMDYQTLLAKYTTLQEILEDKQGE